jgi:hypothetical protein
MSLEQLNSETRAIYGDWDRRTQVSQGGDDGANENSEKEIDSGE